MNLNLVIDTSQFKPFDYRMAWEAIDKYNSGYEKQQAVYDKIAQTLGDLASAVEGSTKAKEIYDAYQQQFNNSASEFFNSGMNIRTARDLGNLRRMYGTQIRQLERANEAMVKEAERRRTAKPELNMLYQDIGNLDNWLENPNRTLGSYSGTQLTNEVSAMANAIGKSIVNRYNNGQLDKYTKLWVENNGLSKENVDKAVAEVQQGGVDSVTDPIMKDILQSAMQSSGIYNWADENTRRTAENIAARGLYGGIGQAKMGTYEDKEAAKQLEYNYAVKLAQKQSEIKQEEAINALRNSGLNNSGGIGETVPLHFSDSKTAGNVMKNRMAQATVDFMKANPNNKYVKKIKEYWDRNGGWEKAKEYWATNGFNGNKALTGGNKYDEGFDKNNSIYYKLGNYLRENVTKNEGLIDVWRSAFISSHSDGKQGYSKYSNVGYVPDMANMHTYTKNWKNFDEEATQGYTYNGIVGADDPTQLSEYLTKMLPLLTSNKQVKLYDIKNIDSSGKITYSTIPTKLEDLPTKTVDDRIQIDTSRITSRITLPDGSWLLTWNDKEGNPVQKVLRRQDRSIEYQGDLNSIDTKLQELKEVYKDNPEMQIFLEQMAIRAKENRGYDVQRQVNVEKQKK